MITTTNHLTKIKKKELFMMSKFVVAENFKHHTNNSIPKTHQSNINSVYEEERSYFKDSHFFLIKSDENEILGTIRSLKWDYINPLPIQKIFGIDPLLCINGRAVNEIWHIGRFAIKKGVRDIQLLKRLMVSAIRPICEHKDNMAFAECDSKLLRVLTLMGIKTKIVGESINYLGSETIPISLSYSGLIDFYDENKHLIESPLNGVLSDQTTL